MRVLARHHFQDDRSNFRVHFFKHSFFVIFITVDVLSVDNPTLFMMPPCTFRAWPEAGTNERAHMCETRESWRR